MNVQVSLTGLRVRTARLGDPADLGRIDAFLAGHGGTQPFHLPQWSLAVERGCGQRAHYLIAERSDGGLAGLLPLTEVRSPLFGSALVSAGFGVGGGILVEDEAALAALADGADQLAEARRCSSIELRGGRFPDSFSFKAGFYAGFAREIPADDEAILTAIPRKQRAEVRKAIGQDMQVSVGRAGIDRQAHFQVYGESVRNLGTPVFPRELFSEMLDRFGEDADILTVSADGRPVASVLSFYFRGTVYPYWGGGTRAARTLRANELMYFELMRHAARRGCGRFDFGRSKVGTGAYAYKKNWGFEPQPLIYAIRTRDGAAARKINPLDPRFSLQIALWQKLPLPLANRLGPLIARGLG